LVSEVIFGKLNLDISFLPTPILDVSNDTVGVTSIYIANCTKSYCFLGIEYVETKISKGNVIISLEGIPETKFITSFSFTTEC
jgi:hypothetical protein